MVRRGRAVDDGEAAGLSSTINVRSRRPEADGRMGDGMMPECLQPFDFVMSERAANVLYMIPAVASVAFVVFTLGFVAFHLIRYDLFPYGSQCLWLAVAALTMLLWFLVFIPRPLPAVLACALFEVPVFIGVQLLEAVNESDAVPYCLGPARRRGWLYSFELLGCSLFIAAGGVCVSMFGRFLYSI